MYLALRKLAAATERPTDELLQIYGLEGFLDRLVQSQHASQFVLKGGVLLAAFNARRPTRDVDLAKTGVADDVDSTRQTMNEILTVVVDDGLIFDTAATTVESIRDGARYEGTRARIFGTLSTGQIRFHVDINFGDPLWPQPESVDIPRSLGGQPIHILGYRIELVLAEKIVTAIQRGTANTRWRDFVDISNLAEADIEDGSLMEAIARTASHRQVTLHPLREVLAGYGPLAQQRWTAWRRKQRLVETTPEFFADLLEQVMAFSDPLLSSLINSR